VSGSTAGIGSETLSRHFLAAYLGIVGVHTVIERSVISSIISRWRAYTVSEVGRIATGSAKSDEPLKVS